jgi:hypothetical protein
MFLHVSKSIVAGERGRSVAASDSNGVQRCSTYLQGLADRPPQLKYDAANRTSPH